MIILNHETKEADIYDPVYDNDSYLQIMEIILSFIKISNYTIMKQPQKKNIQFNEGHGLWKTISNCGIYSHLYALLIMTYGWEKRLTIREQLYYLSDVDTIVNMIVTSRKHNVNWNYTTTYFPKYFNVDLMSKDKNHLLVGSIYLNNVFGDIILIINNIQKRYEGYKDKHKAKFIIVIAKQLEYEATQLKSKIDVEIDKIHDFIDYFNETIDRLLSLGYELDNFILDHSDTEYNDYNDGILDSNEPTPKAISQMSLNDYQTYVRPDPFEENKVLKRSFSIW